MKQWLHLRCTSVLEEGEQSASPPGRSDPQRRAPVAHLEPQSRPGHDKGQKNVCPHLAYSHILQFISPWLSHVYETSSLETPLNKWGDDIKMNER